MYPKYFLRIKVEFSNKTILFICVVTEDQWSLFEAEFDQFNMRKKTNA